jgi:hypothetical protein
VLSYYDEVADRDHMPLLQIAQERLRERPLRPQTALESVVMSNVIRSEVIEKENPFFVQQSRVLGSRLSLEQVRETLLKSKGMILL